MAIGGIVLLLLLLLVANGTPVVVKRVMGDRLARPLDGGRRWADGRPVLGRSKTWRGLLAAVVATAAVAWVLQIGLVLGAAVALAALVGDMASSFTKRRLGIASSGRAIGLDQVPESLLPALVAAIPLGFGLAEVVVVVIVFFVGELALSRVLYHLKIRDEPY
jgi:CDP-2,3-bis-(O-geranylgeranyl)-sn-glycerol synthase